MSKLRIKKFVRDMMRLASELGVSEVRLEWGSRHPFITGTVNGKEFRQMVAGTPHSEYRARRSCEVNFRRHIEQLQDS